MNQRIIPCALVVYRDGTMDLRADVIYQTEIDDPPDRYEVVRIEDGGEPPPWNRFDVGGLTA